MTKLEDITVGSSVKGIISNSTVTIVAVQWYGNNVLEITYLGRRSEIHEALPARQAAF